MNNKSDLSLLSQHDAVKLLRQHQISPTRQRLAIARIILSKKQHLSADVLRDQLMQCHFSVAKATIYNTLSLFVEKGLLQQLNLDHERVFYDSNTAVHHHFYHVDDAQLSDVSINDISLNKMVNLPEGTCLERIDVVVRIKNVAESN